MKILFVLKHRTSNYGHQLSSGLLNSVRFVSDALRGTGMHSHHVQVADDNGIDREVHIFRPDVCVLEAYWARPEKLRELSRLHPRVRWVVRAHSNIPFFAVEAMAMRWTYEYAAIPNVSVAGNSRSLCADMTTMLFRDSVAGTDASDVMYLPNCYPVGCDGDPRKFQHEHGRTVDVGCFGALRPLKNQLAQAMAAIRMANAHGMRLRFHINATRLEGGQPVLKNLEGLFDGFTGQHELVKHDWVEHHEVRELVATMDVGMQVSFTETFNIVTADFVDQLVPVVVSPEVSWVDRRCHASPNATHEMSERLWDAMSWRMASVALENRARLKRYSDDSVETWLNTIQ